MLERNWNWRNNRLFRHIFVIGEITIRRGACLPPLAYTYAPIEENKKGVRIFSARFLGFSNEISAVQKIVLSSSRGQGNFRGLEASRPRPKPRTWGFEAKDFKMCPQGRPQWLHLCFFVGNQQKTRKKVKQFVEKYDLFFRSTKNSVKSRPNWHGDLFLFVFGDQQRIQRKID